MSRWTNKSRAAPSYAFPLDSLVKEKENTNRPVAARSAGTVGKWGTTSFTSIRTPSYGKRDYNGTRNLGVVQRFLHRQAMPTNRRPSIRLAAAAQSAAPHTHRDSRRIRRRRLAARPAPATSPLAEPAQRPPSRWSLRNRRNSSKVATQFRHRRCQCRCHRTALSIRRPDRRHRRRPTCHRSSSSISRMRPRR